MTPGYTIPITALLMLITLSQKFVQLIVPFTISTYIYYYQIFASYS